MTSRIARLALLGLLVGACFAGPSGSATGEPGEVSPSAGGAASPSPGGWPAVSPSSPGVSSRASLAAQRVLDADSAAFEMSVLREKRPADPVERLVVGTGRVEPRLGRGQGRYDLTGLLAPRGSPSPSPSSPSSTALDFELIWTPDDVYFLGIGDTEDWESLPRDQARVRGGLAGRLPDEVLGLVRLVATSPPATATPLDAEQLDGSPAERWLLRVPLEAAVGAGVPADAPNAAVLREAYGIDSVDVEAWLVDGELRRLRFAFDRERAPYGGPDRTTTMYDWRVTPSGDPIAIPSAG